MADSNLTKRALAEALVDLVLEKSFSKVTVSDISEKCDMNRKSFYYHFKDKYDLVCWIFENDFREAGADYYDDFMEFIRDLCKCLEKNRVFYKKVLKKDEENIFCGHIKEMLKKFPEDCYKKQSDNDEYMAFYMDFFVDSATALIKKWITEKDNLSAEEITSMIRFCFDESI